MAAKRKGHENVAAAIDWLELMPAMHDKHLTTLKSRLEEVEDELETKVKLLEAELKKEQNEHERDVTKLKVKLAETEAERKGAVDQLAKIRGVATEPLRTTGKRPDVEVDY